MAAFRLFAYVQSERQSRTTIPKIGLPQWPTPEQYLKAECKATEMMPPTDDPASPVTIRWFTHSNYPGGRIWRLELVVFGPNERIFDRKPYQHDKVYWSQDTRTHLTREATCASAALQNGYRVFVTTRGHSDTLDEDAVDVRIYYDQRRFRKADSDSVKAHTTSQHQVTEHASGMRCREQMLSKEFVLPTKRNENQQWTAWFTPNALCIVMAVSADGYWKEMFVENTANLYLILVDEPWSDPHVKWRLCNKQYQCKA